MKINVLCACLFLSSLLGIAAASTVIPDLSQDSSPFILEQKQIFIPGYPDAFNPSIVRWYDGRLLLSFRARDPLTQYTNLMGFAWLNEDFEVEGTPTLLQIHHTIPLAHSRAQDPRLLRVGKKYYIVYNNILSDSDLETRRMLMAPLLHNSHGFSINQPEYLLNFIGDPKNWREKNWSPFNYQGKLFFSYSLHPHRVFHPLQGSNSCQTVAVTQADIDWPWGELRGGTPALLDGNHYIGFFHSFIDMPSVQSNGKKISHYFMGAYLFNKKFPFDITSISPEPIIGSTFYTAPDYPTWKPLRVVFPGGLIIDNQFIWVVYGKQDYECWVVKLDKLGLLNSLVPVTSETLHIESR